MRSMSPVSTLLALGLCLSGAGLSGCDLPKGDGQDFQRMAARLDEIELDGKAKEGAEASAQPEEKLELVFETAKDVAVGEGGLAAHAPKMQIRIVSPLEMDGPRSGTPLDTGVNETMAAPQLAITSEPKPVSKPKTNSAAMKTIQIGSFSSEAGAETAWRDLQARHPGLDQFRPVMQPVTTAQGKAMVRLKLGPVTSPEQAARLCEQLNITDAWCVKAG